MFSRRIKGTGSVLIAIFALFAPAEARPGTALLSVMTYNIHKGRGTDNIYNIKRVAQVIKDVDVVFINEAYYSAYDDLFLELKSQTGVAWYRTPVLEGDCIFSRLPLKDVQTKRISYTIKYQRGVVKAVINTVAGPITLVVTHLDNSNSDTRLAQVGELLSFTKAFRDRPLIIGGDFNFQASDPEYLKMRGEFSDTWVEALRGGKTAAYQDNKAAPDTRTHSHRIDYIWQLTPFALPLQVAEVPDTRDLANTKVRLKSQTADDRGVRPSDHNPMRVVFRL